MPFRDCLLVALARLGVDAETVKLTAQEVAGLDEAPEVMARASMGLVELDASGVVRSATARAREVLGPGSRLADCLHPSQRPSLESALLSAEEGVTCLLQTFLPSGQAVALSLTKSGPHLVGWVRSVEPLGLGDAVAYRAAFDSCRDGLLLVDEASATVRQANHAAAVLLGRPPAALVGSAVSELLEATGLSAFLGASGPGPLVHPRVGDLTRHFEVVGGRVGEAHATVLLTLRDVTARRRLEDEREVLHHALHQAQKFEALGQLASGVAHDLKNVLAVVVGLGATLFEESRDEALRNDLSQILEAARKGSDLTRQLLGFARKEPMHREPLDFYEAVRTAAKLASRLLPPRVRLVVDVAPGFRSVVGDRSQLEQTVINLVVNARDAMPDGGTITVSATADERRAQVQVRDTGSGMTDDVLKRAFQPFFTTKPRGEGTGLGLALVYASARGHGGDVRIESEPGVGTVVTLWLPAVPTSRPSPVPTFIATRGAALLVDDDENTRAIGQALLQKLGFEVHVASHGDEAIELVKRGVALNVVVCDLVMPGTTGIETLRSLRGLRPTLPLVATSGFLDSKELTAASEAGVNATLTKPFTSADLRRVLGQAGLDLQS